jgi:hypothetical protein
VFFARQGATFYWVSRHDAQHSIDIRESSHAFIVISDSTNGHASGGAAYIDADARELTGEPSGQRIYVAVARRVWTDGVHASGAYPRDERIEISLA